MLQLHRRCTILSKKKCPQGVTHLEVSFHYCLVILPAPIICYYSWLFLCSPKCSHYFLLLLAQDDTLRWDLRLFLRLPWLCPILVLIQVSSKISHFSYLSREGQDIAYLSLVNGGYSISCTYFVKRKMSRLPNFFLGHSSYHTEQTGSIIKTNHLNAHMSSCKLSNFCQILTTIGVLTIFAKTPNMKFHKIHNRGCRFVPWGQNDGRIQQV